MVDIRVGYREVSFYNSLVLNNILSLSIALKIVLNDYTENLKTQWQKCIYYFIRHFCPL